MASVETTISPFVRNATGTPNPDDYLLGKGEVYWSELTTADVPDANGFVHLGNCPELTIIPSSEFLEHYSSMSSTKQLDQKILIQQKFDVKLRLEEMNEFNASLFFAATPAATTANVAVAGFTNYAMVTAPKKGRWYPIVNSSGVRARGVTSANLTVTKTSGAGAMTLNTDYQVDEPGGRIKFLSTGAVIVDGDSVSVALAANANADATREIPVQSRTSSVTGCLVFYGVNPKTGRKYELLIPKVTLAAEGEFNMISEQLTSLSLSGSAERKDTSTYVATITALPAGGTS
jgi:hypothetical protein